MFTGAQYMEDISTGGTVTAPAIAHTESAIVQLNAATSREYHALIVSARNSVTARSTLYDLLIGASGSEHHLVQDGLAQSGDSAQWWHSYIIPRRVPKGSRLSTRARADVTTGVILEINVEGLVYGLPAGVATLQEHTNFGADTADSGGLQVDPGAVADTFGSWIVFSSSTPFTIKYLVVIVDGKKNTAPAASYWQWQIGVGAATTEYAKYGSPYNYVGATIAEENAPKMFPLSVHIPAGSRLVLRAASNTTNATDRLRDVVMLAYGE